MNKKMKGNKGFTLIELLVVIGIIGILAGIVLVSLRGTQDKARDARIISDMGQVRSEASIIYSDNGNYASTCGSDAKSLGTDPAELQTIQKDIKSQQGGTLDMVCHAGKDTNGDYQYCAAAKLKTAKNGWYCVDSSGVSGDKYTSSSCDSTNFTCAKD